MVGIRESSHRIAGLVDSFDLQQCISSSFISSKPLFYYCPTLSEGLLIVQVRSDETANFAGALHEECQ